MGKYQFSEDAIKDVKDVLGYSQTRQNWIVGTIKN